MNELPRSVLERWEVIDREHTRLLEEVARRIAEEFRPHGLRAVIVLRKAALLLDEELRTAGSQSRTGRRSRGTVRS